MGKKIKGYSIQNNPVGLGAKTLSEVPMQQGDSKPPCKTSKGKSQYSTKHTHLRSGTRGK